MTLKIPFFATKSDVLRILGSIQLEYEAKYILAETHDSPEAQQWFSGDALPLSGQAEGPQESMCATYLITNRDASVQFRKIAQWDGRIRFDIDQLANPESITFTPAGEWTNNTIIAGNFGTAWDSDTSKKLMLIASRAIKKSFTKIRAFHVGPEALVRFRSGWRLTIAEQSPPLYDLQE